MSYMYRIVLMYFLEYFGELLMLANVRRTLPKTSLSPERYSCRQNHIIENLLILGKPGLSWILYSTKSSYMAIDSYNSVLMSLSLHSALGVRIMPIQSVDSYHSAASFKAGPMTMFSLDKNINFPKLSAPLKKIPLFSMYLRKNDCISSGILSRSVFRSQWSFFLSEKQMIIVSDRNRVFMWISYPYFRKKGYTDNGVFAGYVSETVLWPLQTHGPATYQREDRIKYYQSWNAVIHMMIRVITPCIFSGGRE